MTYGRGWFSPGTPVSSINKTYRHDITEKNVESGAKHVYPLRILEHFYSDFSVDFFYRIYLTLPFNSHNSPSTRRINFISTNLNLISPKTIQAKFVRYGSVVSEEKIEVCV